jgi:hypothetical protein
VTLYRFLDGLGDVVAQGEFPDHATALEWATVGARHGQGEEEEEEEEVEVQRVEYLGPEGDWRWAGPLQG